MYCKCREWSKIIIILYCLQVDVDANTETSESQNISAMPTFFFFFKGVKYGEVIGASEAKLKEMLGKLNDAK